MGGPKTFPQALLHERSHISRPLYCGDLILEEDSRAEIPRGPRPSGVSVAYEFYIMVSCLPLRGHHPFQVTLMSPFHPVNSGDKV